MTERLVDLGGYSLAVKDRGSGPAVLFGHSLTFDSAMFDRVADRLVERFRVVQVDLPGHGGSGTPKEIFSLEEVADDLPGLLDGLGIDRAAWVGHSMGGMVGMRFALQHPRRVGALALLNTSADAEIPNMRDLYDHVNESSRGKPSTKPTVEFVLSLMFSEAFRAQHPDRVEPYRTLLYEPTDAEGVYRMARSVIWRDSVLELLGSLDTPCLVITASLDTAVPAHFGESISQTIPGCRSLQLEDCGHLSPEERPEEVAPAIQSFLEEAWT